MQDEKKMPAIDLSHHLSDVAKARQVSPLKGIFKYIEQNPNIISMAGGIPSPTYFPFATLEADALVSTSFLPGASSNSSTFGWFWSLLGFPNSDKVKTSHVTVPKFPANKEDINLAVALQYGTAQGLGPLKDFIQEFTGKVFQPGYSNFATLVHAGNTDGWSKAVTTFCNKGECFLTEEWTYPSAMAGSAPFNVKPIAVKVDAEGMRADDLEVVLSTWNEQARGMKQPHVMYTVPCGQNPTGSNMYGQRKKAIYDICVKYDVLIVEDDPYYFLQEGKYTPKSLRKQPPSFWTEDQANKEFIESLAPSYLKFDYQGRVIRLDTFSKTIAPGARLGWFTCNPVFAERLERQGETTTQAPCGFSQSIIAQLLTKEWTLAGYMRWLRGIQTEYTARRDTIIDLFAEAFHLEMERGTGLWEGQDMMVAYHRPSGAHSFYMNEKNSAKPILSFIPPTAGMFIWFRVYIEDLPGLKRGDWDGVDSLEQRLWIKFAEGGILVGSGMLFAADKTDDRLASQAHYRISFSSADQETMKKAIKTIKDVITAMSK